nr:hypothetical protein [Tanacetum cinerariifolium]
LNTLGMERGFLSQNGSKVGRGVKEKRDGVSPSMTVETMGSTPAGNASGMSSYANVTGNTPGICRSKYGLVKSMLNSSTGLFMFQFTSMDVLNAMLEKGPWSSYARAIIELWSNEELKDTIVVAMPRITGGATANSSGNKKKGVEPTNEVSNLNPFDVLNTVDNDMELGTNGGTSNFGNKWLIQVEYLGDHDSEDEVASVDNDIARSIASERVGFGTQSLESKVMRECCFVVERDAWLRGEFTLSSLDVLQGFSFFLKMGFTLILATLDGLDVGLLGDVIGEDDCDDDG